MNRLEHLLAEVNAPQRLTRFDDRGKLLFERLRTESVATFVLPPRTYNDEEKDHVTIASTVDSERILYALTAMPFPCVRIQRRIFSVAENESIDTDVIVVRDLEPHAYLWASKDTVHRDGKLRVFYTPNNYIPQAITQGVPASLLGLIEFLEERRNRYIEQPISRQVRRAEGLSPEHRTYIVIRKPPAKEAKTMLRLSEVFRRSPKLHAVRGHLVHYRNERYTNARGKVGYKGPFVRGHGTMLQVKDYVAEEVRLHDDPS